ncbi:MAG: hypothetical protein JNM63_11715 [Spirochaetia bacterium]|nr:hypothetical protein [Spirochaetia bacterium]
MVRLYELLLRFFFALILAGAIAAFSLEYAGIDLDDCGHDPLTHAMAVDECHGLCQLLHSPFLEEKCFETDAVPSLIGQLVTVEIDFHPAAPCEIPVPPA